MRRVDRRISFALKLDPIRDADLIAWITAITKGDRQNTVKTVLRAGAGLARRDKLDDVLAEVRALAKKVAALKVVAAGGEDDDAPKISDAEAQEMRQQILKNGW